MSETSTMPCLVRFNVPTTPLGTCDAVSWVVIGPQYRVVGEALTFHIGMNWKALFSYLTGIFGGRLELMDRVLFTRDSITVLDPLLVEDAGYPTYETLSPIAGRPLLMQLVCVPVGETAHDALKRETRMQADWNDCKRHLALPDEWIDFHVPAGMMHAYTQARVHMPY